MRLKRMNNWLLLGCLTVMLVLCVVSVTGPMSFESERRARETVVKARMAKIMTAEELFRHKHGIYAGELKTLVDSGLLADSLQYVPYSDGRRFTVEATVETTRSGQENPSVTISTTYEDYLRGLDENEIAKLIEKGGEGIKETK